MGKFPEGINNGFSQKEESGSGFAAPPLGCEQRTCLLTKMCNLANSSQPSGPEDGEGGRVLLSRQLGRERWVGDLLISCSVWTVCSLGRCGAELRGSRLHSWLHLRFESKRKPSPSLPPPPSSCHTHVMLGEMLPGPPQRRGSRRAASEAGSGAAGPGYRWEGRLWAASPQSPAVHSAPRHTRWSSE